MTCKQCGWDNESGARACAGCGAELAPAPGPPGPPPAPTRPSPAARATRTRGSSAKWWVLGGITAGLVVAGTLVGLMVIYPAREAAKIRALYPTIASDVGKGDLESVLALTTGEAKADLAQLAPVGKLVKNGGPLRATCTITVKDVQVRARKATATVDVAVAISGTLTLPLVGSQVLQEQQQATETHEWTREGSDWKIASWGQTGGFHQLAQKAAPLQGLLGQLGAGR
jgi:hypothetical protein